VPLRTGKYVVPVLWDKKTRTIVNNESSEIIRMFNTAFNEHAANADLELRPDDLAGEIDAVNAWVYPGINNGVYRCARRSGVRTQAAPPLASLRRATGPGVYAMRLLHRLPVCLLAAA
jgi:glutathionyl-hydroquinone reductase